MDFSLCVVELNDANDRGSTEGRVFMFVPRGIHPQIRGKLEVKESVRHITSV